ncbi:MAG: hypothetical protein Q8T09_01180 [Candidatus Melainabacteria bacterium]|nr:hypothetical protein [Candidatus Melainabacteria bacterium]
MNLEINDSSELKLHKPVENQSHPVQGNVFLGFFIPGQYLLLRSTANERNNQPPPVVTYKVSNLFNREEN